jgi:serine/threonine-protein phosphatase 2A regulatory subunit A
LTIPDLIAITSNLDAAETKEHMLDSIRNAVTDKSWRVRYMVANEFVNLAESVGEAIVKEELVGAFVGLLKDQEAEVRTASASQVPGMFTVVSVI